MPASPLYRCPGEEYTISRSVHLARMAAFYPKCRECPHRLETATVSLPVSSRDSRASIVEAATRRLPLAPNRSLVTARGFRGVYLNAISRQTAAEIAGALASLLWEAAPHLAVAQPHEIAGRSPSRAVTSVRGPAIVVGHDERPASRDLVVGVAAGLRRMSCEVIDIGLATRPSFWHVAQHLSASGGILATGSGCDPAWTGLDICGAGGLPLSQSGTEMDLDLTAIDARWKAGYNRSTRHSGSQRSFQGWVPYETGLWKYFHALRPLQVVVACSSHVIRELITRLFQKLPCRLIEVETPQREADMQNAHDPDVVRVSNAVLDNDAHFGVLIGDDGQRVSVVDERGIHLPPETVGQWLADFMQSETPGPIVWSGAESTLEANHPDGIQSAAVHFTAASQSAIAHAMQSTGAVYGGGHGGEHWFRTPYPTCDAVITLAWMLQALSRSDAELSHLTR